MCTNFWHTQWDLSTSHLFLHPRNLQVSNLPRSMVLMKSQMPKNATKSIGGSISSSTSIGFITRNKAKAKELFSSQEADGKAPMTKLINASTQPKTFISLSTLWEGKHTIAKKENSTFTRKDLDYLFNLHGKLISYNIHVDHDDRDYYR